MNKMKRFFSLLLMAALVLTLSVAAYAAGDGSITINNATTGETYKLYKVFDATTQGADETKSVAYVYTKTDDSDVLYEALAAKDSPFTLTATTAENKYNVSLKTGKTASDVSAFFKANESLLGTGTETEASNTTVTFSNLDYGYYYISKKNSGDGANPTVGVTSVAPSQTINDKSAKPGPITPDKDNPGGYKVFVDKDGTIQKKTVTDGNAENINQTASYGDTVYFMLQANGVNYDEGRKVVSYTAYDELGAGFKDFTVTKVTVGDNTLTKDTDYTVETNESPNTVKIKWINDDGNHIYANGGVINVYCQATVDTDATVGNETATNLTNKGWFSWTFDNGATEPTDPSEESSTVTAKVYAIAIAKTDKKGNALKDAQFEIVDGNGNKVPVTLDSTASDGGTNVYTYTPNGTNYTVTSPESGKIIIKGVAGGDYTVNEIVAPDGYNLLEAGVKVNASEFESSTTTLTVYKDTSGDITGTETTTKQEFTFDVSSAAVNVVNYTGTELPSTGGVGTTLFYVIGALLMVGAFILLVTKKRMNTEK